MWISRKLTSVVTTTTASSIKEEEQQQQKYISFQNKASALIDRFNKPLPPILGGGHGFVSQQQQNIPLVIIVSGASNIGKSTFIRFGLQNLIAKHDSNRPDLQCHHTKIILDQINYPIDIIELTGSNIENQDLPTMIHGGLVCYDTTDRDSLDCIPDLLNFYLSRNIPTFLIGLKSDLIDSCQVDPNLIQQLVDLFTLEHFQVDAFSDTGVQQMQDIYKSLIKHYYPRNSKNKQQQQQQQQQLEVKTRHSMHIIDEPAITPGFVYAPTRKDSMTIDQAGVTSGSQADPDKEGSNGLTQKNHIISFSPPPPPSHHQHLVHMMTTATNKRTTFPSHFNHLSSRRGSKDSSESFGIGLTKEDIVDRLLSTEYSKTDENIIPIFLTFFRKFMRPYELVKMLVDRFENDGLSSDNLPTDLQKRIHSIFSLWLSHYWNDFYGSHARKNIILFLDRISKYENFTPICDSLAPLVIREPPIDDPDKLWGLVDDLEEEEDDEDTQPISPPATPVSPTTVRRNKNDYKKDSAYASGTFSLVLPQSPTNTDKPPQLILKRMSSQQNLSQQPLLSPNLNRILLRTSSNSKKSVTHSESHPDLRSSYVAAQHHTKSPLSCFNNNNNNTTQLTSPTVELPRRAEFAGGLINIDNAIKKPPIKNPHFPSSIIAPSIATTSGGRWTLGNHLLASSFISTFRQSKSDKDQTSYNYKIFIKAADITVADQLTWIEAELFSRIKPREFIRNIWNTTTTTTTTPVNNTNNKHASITSFTSSNNTVLASIAHFNFISAWVVTMIVTQSRLSKRVALLSKFMSIAVELRNLNNYNSLMAILAGINSASVLRLKQTRQAVVTKKIYKQFQSLERLMSTDRSFSSYRMALKASGAPGIPYLGIHNQDLVSLAEANKDFRADGTIHWDKFRLMGETIMATMKFKCPSYTIEPDAKLLAFIADTYILSEDEQYKRSMLIEPRLASSSTNRIRDLWLRM